MEGAHSFPINHGMCVRYHDLAKVETTGDNTRTLISLLRGKPYELPLKLEMVERHPFGSQAFVPFRNPFLVVAAHETGWPARPLRSRRNRAGREHSSQCLARHFDAA